MLFVLFIMAIWLVITMAAVGLGVLKIRRDKNYLEFKSRNLTISFVGSSVLFFKKPMIHFDKPRRGERKFVIGLYCPFFLFIFATDINRWFPIYMRRRFNRVMTDLRFDAKRARAPWIRINCPDDGECGRSGPNGKEYCRDHERYYSLMFPQGWDYYPGDVCEHSSYTGGCGIDYLCHYCEMGDDRLHWLSSLSYRINRMLPVR